MNKKIKFFAYIIILISTFCVWYYGQMVYDDVFGNSSIIYCFRPPLFVSVLNLLLAIFGTLIGIKVLKNQLKLKKGLLITFILLILIFLIDNFGHLLL
ncbi:membrane hypothetical protein [Tenacibaculum finnmarkense]|nr:membrane hypothetical protein [Tenacibaculum finnmarkense]